MNDNIKIEQPDKAANRFVFFVGCTVELSKDDIWFDGDVPKIATTKDVLERINGVCDRLNVGNMITAFDLPCKVVIRPK